MLVLTGATPKAEAEARMEANVRALNFMVDYRYCSLVERNVWSVKTVRLDGGG